MLFVQSDDCGKGCMCMYCMHVKMWGLLHWKTRRSICIYIYILLLRTNLHHVVNELIWILEKCIFSGHGQRHLPLTLAHSPHMWLYPHTHTFLTTLEARLQSSNGPQHTVVLSHGRVSGWSGLRVPSLYPPLNQRRQCAEAIRTTESRAASRRIIIIIITCSLRTEEREEARDPAEDDAS